MFALGDKVIGNPQLATFAAFGSFAMLLLVDFGGPMAERFQAQAAPAVIVLGVGGPLLSALAGLAAAVLFVLAAHALLLVNVRDFSKR